MSKNIRAAFKETTEEVLTQDAKTFVKSGRLTKEEILSNVWSSADEGARFLAAARDKAYALNDHNIVKMDKFKKRTKYALCGETMLMTFFTTRAFMQFWGIDDMEGQDLYLGVAGTTALSLGVSAGRVYAQYQLMEAAFDQLEKGNKGTGIGFIVGGLSLAAMHSFFIAFQAAEEALITELEQINEEISEIQEAQAEAVERQVEYRDAMSVDNDPQVRALTQELTALRAEQGALIASDGPLLDGSPDNDRAAQARLDAIESEIETRESRLEQLRANATPVTIDVGSITAEDMRKLEMLNDRAEELTEALNDSKWPIFESPKTFFETMSIGAALSVLNGAAGYFEHQRKELEEMPHATPENTMNPLRNRQHASKTPSFMGCNIVDMSAEDCLKNFEIIQRALDDVTNPETVRASLKENVAHQVNNYRKALNVALEQSLISEGVYRSRLGKLEKVADQAHMELDSKQAIQRINKLFSVEASFAGEASLSKFEVKRTRAQAGGLKK